MRIINVPGRGIGQHSLDELAKWAGTQGISQYEALQRLAGQKPVRKLPFSARIAKTLGNFGSLLKEMIAGSREMGLRGLLRPACHPARI